MFKLSITLAFILVLTATTSARQGGAQHGLIYIHSLGFPVNECLTIKKYLGLDEDKVRLECPMAQCKPHYVLSDYLTMSSPKIGPLFKCFSSWFNSFLYPQEAVESPTVVSNRGDITESADIIESIIEDMIADGIPSQNIVLLGLSQGGALAMYEAVHSKYRLGAFVSVAAWYPNLQVDPPARFHSNNYATPIFQINGGSNDKQVPLIAGAQTSRAMKKAFPYYEFENIESGGHLLVFPRTLKKIRVWLKRHHLLSFVKEDVPHHKEGFVKKSFGRLAESKEEVETSLFMLLGIGSYATSELVRQNI